MKLLFYILAVFFIAVIAGLLAAQDPGYVLIGRGFQTMEMSLSLFVTLQILLFVFLYLLIRFVSRTWHMPDSLRHWRRGSRYNKARDSLRRGLIELAQGRWKQAEKDLTRHVHDYDMPLLNYLSAARAAQKLNAPDRRDLYLSLAHKSMPEADMAVELTQAELQMNHGQLEQALATLVHMHALYPKHTHVLLLLSRLYEQLNSWGDLEELLPSLKKYKVLDDKELHDVSIRVYLALINIAANTYKARNLDDVWQRIPGKLREQEQLLKPFVQKLIELESYDQAESMLRDAIKHHWDNQLVYLYGLVKSSQPEKQLSTAESWLKGKENNHELLLTLGRLSMNTQLWGKAQSYLESSLGYGEKAETYKELGILLEKLDDQKGAADCFRKGLLLATKGNG